MSLGTAPGKTSAYKLTLIKKLSESTRPSKVKERVADLDLVGGLYVLYVVLMSFTPARKGSVVLCDSVTFPIEKVFVEFEEEHLAISFEECVKSTCANAASYRFGAGCHIGDSGFNPIQNQR